MNTVCDSKEMINRIKYNTCAFWGGDASYFSFEAKWETNAMVYFKIKSISDSPKERRVFNKKGYLDFNESKYFVSIVNSIDFIKFKKESTNVNVIVEDGESNILKVKTDRYCGRILWETYALKSEYINSIKSLVRICKKHKDVKSILTIM